MRYEHLPRLDATPHTVVTIARPRGRCAGTARRPTPSLKRVNALIRQLRDAARLSAEQVVTLLPQTDPLRTYRTPRRWREDRVSRTNLLAHVQHGAHLSNTAMDIDHAAALFVYIDAAPTYVELDRGALKAHARAFSIN